MSKTLTWLHISDLHLCKPKHGWDADQVLEALRIDFKHMIGEHNLNPDLIFFTGDVAYGQLGDQGFAMGSQYEEAAILFEEIRTQFSPEVMKENFFIVPGNHDVNRDRILKATTHFLDSLIDKNFSEALQEVTALLQSGNKDWQACMERLADYRAFLETYGFDHLLQDKEHLIYHAVREINGIQVGVAGLNSAWSCSGKREKGKLWLGGHWQIQNVRPNIKDATVKIVLMHHPLNWFSPVEDPVLIPEIERTFDFFLHGHEHQNWVTPNFEGHTRIAAGACYGSSEEESGYNFVRLDIDNGIGEVWLRRFGSDGAGWVPRAIRGKTNNDGLWQLKNLSRLVGTRFTPADHEGHNPIGPPGPLLSGPESRGVFGRESDIQKLSHALKQKAIVTIYGMPGIGKSELIREALHNVSEEGITYIRFRLYPDMKLPELYRQLAATLGSREENPVLFEIAGIIDFSPLKRYANAACIIHLDMAHELFQKGPHPDTKNIKLLLEAIAKHIPRTRIILESRVNPPVDLFPASLYTSLKISGLKPQSVRAYFQHPFKNKSDKGWNLTEDEIATVYRKLGGKSKDQHAHPLAMFLLATVADGRGLTPIQVLKRYEDALATSLEQELFNELYDYVLSAPEQRVLSLCALYRDDIPDSHVSKLNYLAGQPDAFDLLVLRCLLTSDDKQEWFYLHSIINSLAMRRRDQASTEFFDDHENIADAWLTRAEQSSRLSLPSIRAASEAAYHLIKAECYERLDELANRSLWGNLTAQLEIVSKRLYQNHKFKEQRYVLELMVALDPDNAMNHRYLGDAIEAVEGRGDEEALKHYLIAFELQPDFSNNLGCIGQCALARQEPEVFIDIVTALDGPSFRDVMDNYNLDMYCKCLSKLSDKEQASQLRQAQIQEGVRRPAFYNDEAAYLRDKGQSDDALVVINKAERLGVADTATNRIRDSIQERNAAL